MLSDIVFVSSTLRASSSSYLHSLSLLPSIFILFVGLDFVFNSVMVLYLFFIIFVLGLSLIVALCVILFYR